MLLGLVPGAATNFAAAASLDNSAQQRIRAATFEVVQRKPDEGAIISYDRPYPWSSCPIRSAGTSTAPSASPSRSERTATCRPDMCLRSAWAAATGRRRCAMRDREDFVVFSTRTEPKDVQPLELGPTPAVNDAVFAVGNALGQGVVVRNGVYTSDTPEEQSGQWRWLRFSAAASPGNSGGPLIDQAARVGRGTPRGPFRHPPADPRCERDAPGARAIRVTDDSAAVLLKAAEHSRLRSAPRRHGKEVLLPGTDAGPAVHVDN